MIASVIEYLTRLPTPTTSPIYQAVNTAAMQTAMSSGGGSTVVNVYTTAQPKPVVPFVRVYASSERPQGQQFIGGASAKAYTEGQILMVECVAKDVTDTGAGVRGEYLRMAVEAAIVKALSGNTIARRNDLGGTGSFDQLSWWQIQQPGSEPGLEGPGDTASGSPVWTSTRLVRVRLEVLHIRSA